MSEEVEQPDGGENLPATTSSTESLPPVERIDNAADGLAAFNRVLWEIARTFGIITAILMAVFFLFMAWQVAQWGMATL